MGCYGIKFGVQLVDGFTQSFIGLSLSRYELLHKTLQIRLGLKRLLLRRWIIWSPMLETRRLRLRGIGRNGIVILVGEIRMISPSEVICV